ncbi:MAG: glycosyltransferase family 4 protein [Kiritimatiellae bacterium]|nr:glycosyltransferase family 4 protein [Kiritimatiellia bacterium]
MNGHEDSQQPRVCFVISTFFPYVGGGETHSRLLCREMIRLGAEVFVITRRTAPDLPKRDTVEGIPVERVPPVASRRLAKYLMLFPVFARLVARRHDYDVILVSGLRLLGIPAMFAALLFRKTCILRAASCGELSGAFIWDSPHIEEKGKPRWYFRAMVALRNKLLLKAHGFLGISEAIGDEYRECGVPEEKIAVINNGTDTELFQPVLGEERQKLRQELGLPDGWIAAYTGKLNQGKGLDFLLEVWNDFAPRHPEAHLVLVGSGSGNFLSQEAALRAYVNEHNLSDRVTFTGYVQNVHAYLQAADIFTFPSENESLSNALIEALACGIPCLASNIGGIPDTVRDNFNGRLLPARSHADWVRALESAWSNPAQVAQWSRQGRERIMDRNSMESVARRHMAFVQACRDGKGEAT